MSDVIGGYEVRELGAGCGVVRYEATHVVLPRRAIVELAAAGAPRDSALALMRHACILEALHHPGVPRVFECGLLDGRPWVAFERCEGVTLEEELRRRKLDGGEVLDLLAQVAAILCHAHARGVLHRDITPGAIVLGPTVVLTRWDNACAHDASLAPDCSADVAALATIALEALADHSVVPAGLATLLARMLSADKSTRPTTAEVIATVRALRYSLPATEIKDAQQDASVVASASPSDDYAALEYSHPEDDEEPVLLERSRLKPRWTPQWGVDEHGPRTLDTAEMQTRVNE